MNKAQKLQMISVVRMGINLAEGFLDSYEEEVKKEK